MKSLNLCAVQTYFKKCHEEFTHTFPLAIKFLPYIFAFIGLFVADFMAHYLIPSLYHAFFLEENLCPCSPQSYSLLSFCYSIIAKAIVFVFTISLFTLKFIADIPQEYKDTIDSFSFVMQLVDKILNN